MHVHRFRRQTQFSGNLFDRHTLRQFFRHLTLAFGERILTTGRQFDGDVRRQVTAAGRYGMHRRDQLIRATTFRKETTRARR